MLRLFTPVVLLVILWLPIATPTPCGPAQYYNFESKTCDSCDIRCSACTGPRNNDCSSCATGYLHTPALTKCSSECPVGYYKVGTSCSTCSSSCEGCNSSATSCTSCPAMQILDSVSHTCSPYSCPATQYLGPGSVCTACPSNCDFCSSSTVCEICSTGYYLAQTVCVDTCPPGYCIGYQANANTKLVPACVMKSPVSLQIGSMYNDPTLIALSSSAVIENFQYYLSIAVTATVNNNASLFKGLSVQMENDTFSHLTFSYTDSFDDGSTLTINFNFFDNQSDATQKYSLSSSVISIIVAGYTVLTPSNQQFLNFSALVSKIGGKFMTGALFFKNLDDVGTSLPLRLSQVMEIMQYTRYINIKFPPNIRSLFQSSPASPISFSFLPNIPHLIIQAAGITYNSDRTVASIFGNYDLSASFLFNYGDSISTTIMILLIIACLDLILRRKKKLHWRVVVTLEKFGELLKWNFILTAVFGHLHQMSFYVLMELTNPNFDTGYDILSFCVAILFLILLIGFFVVIFRLSKKIACPTAGKNSENLLRWVVLFADYRFKNRYQKFFLVGISIRALLSSIIIVSLRFSPITQMFVLFLTSLFIFLSLIIIRPFEAKKDFSQQCINEFVLVAFNACGIYFVISQSCDYVNTPLNNGIGMMMVVLSTLITTFNIILTSYDFIVSSWRIARVLLVFFKSKNRDDFEEKVENVRKQLMYQMKLRQLKKVNAPVKTGLNSFRKTQRDNAMIVRTDLAENDCKQMKNETWELGISPKTLFSSKYRAYKQKTAKGSAPSSQISSSSETPGSIMSDTLKDSCSNKENGYLFWFGSRTTKQSGIWESQISPTANESARNILQSTLDDLYQPISGKTWTLNRKLWFLAESSQEKRNTSIASSPAETLNPSLIAIRPDCDSAKSQIMIDHIKPLRSPNHRNSLIISPDSSLDMPANKINTKLDLPESRVDSLKVDPETGVFSGKSPVFLNLPIIPESQTDTRSNFERAQTATNNDYNGKRLSRISSNISDSMNLKVLLKRAGLELKRKSIKNNIVVPLPLATENNVEKANSFPKKTP